MDSDGEVIGCLSMLTRTGRRQHYSREDRERLVTNRFIAIKRQTNNTLSTNPHTTQCSDAGATEPCLDELKPHGHDGFAIKRRGLAAPSAHHRLASPLAICTAHTISCAPPGPPARPVPACSTRAPHPRVRRAPRARVPSRGQRIGRAWAEGRAANGGAVAVLSARYELSSSAY